MTMLDDDRDSSATAVDTAAGQAAYDISKGRPPADVALLARAEWHASGGTLTGRQLAERYGRSPRWGQKQRAAAEREAAERAGAGAATVSATVPRPARPKVNGTPRPSAQGRPAARGGTPPARTAWPLLALSVGSVALVTAVCAVVSYSHIQHLAQLAGMDGLSWVLPLGIDGLVVTCSCSLIVDRQRERRGNRLARAGIVLGFVGSVVANVLAVDPGLVDIRVVQWVLAGYTPAALAVTVHLLTRILGER